MEDVKTIKVYGERNTNTNYINKLISLNLNLVELTSVAPPKVYKAQKKLPGNEWLIDLYFKHTFDKNLGWKHTLVPAQETLFSFEMAKQVSLFLTITKNPYSWLLSLYKKPYHQYYNKKLSFEEFLKHPWKVVKRDNLPADLENPIQLWNLKNASYLSLPQHVTANITTESIFSDPEETINKIGEKSGAKRKSVDFINFNSSTKKSGKTTQNYRDYYLNEEWRTEVSEEAISLINASLDKELMNHFNYKLLK